MNDAVGYCKCVDEVNALIDKADRMKEDTSKLANRIFKEKDVPPIFFKDVDFLVRASHGHDHNLNDLRVKRLEIRPRVESGSSKIFSFSLMLVLVMDNGETFWFRIAKTNNFVDFFIVQCCDDDGFVIETGNDVCAEFFSQEDFMEVINFCYDAIDDFNEELDVKLVEHLQYRCSLPIVRNKKDLLPTGYLPAGTKVALSGTDGKGGPVTRAVVHTGIIESDFGNKVINLVKYKGDTTIHRFIFVPGGNGLIPGWYRTKDEYSDDYEGPGYKIEPI